MVLLNDLIINGFFRIPCVFAMPVLSFMPGPVPDGMETEIKDYCHGEKLIRMRPGERLQCKAFCFQVPIPAPACSNKLQDTIIGVGNSLFVEHFIAGPPDSFFRFLISQYIHGALQHYPGIAEGAPAEKIDRRF